MTSQTNATASESAASRVYEPPAPADVGADRWLIDDPATYERMHAESVADPSAFYGTVAKDLHWFKGWDSVVEFESPDAVWFKGATTNLCYNCVDRHVADGHGDEIGLIWEGEPVSKQGGGRGGEHGPHMRALSYAELQREISRFANALKTAGVREGDVVTIYMGMVPEPRSRASRARASARPTA